MAKRQDRTNFRTLVGLIDELDIVWVKIEKGEKRIKFKNYGEFEAFHDKLPNSGDIERADMERTGIELPLASLGINYFAFEYKNGWYIIGNKPIYP